MQLQAFKSTKCGWLRRRRSVMINVPIAEPSPSGRTQFCLNWPMLAPLITGLAALLLWATASMAWGQNVGGTTLGEPHNLGATDTVPQFSWTSASGANRYYIVVAESRALVQDISSNNLGTCRDAAGNKRGCVISYLTTTPSHTAGSADGVGGWTAGLSLGKQYFWAVQPYNTNGQDGPWTAIRSFSTIPAVATTSPSSGKTTSITPTFQWKNTSGATKYWLVVAEQPGLLPQNPQDISCNGNCKINQNMTGLSFTANTNDLQSDTKYYWRVQGYKPRANSNPIANGKWGDVQQFRTGAAGTSDLVPRDIVVNPITTLPGADVTVTWRLANEGSAAANAASNTVVRINQAPDPSFAVTVQSAKGIYTPALASNASIDQSAVLTLPPGVIPGTYYAWVIADNERNVSNESATGNNMLRSRPFTVQNDTGKVFLTVNVTGQGRVTGAGIDCGNGGSDCSEPYDLDTKVTLTAMADTDFSFSGWSGGGCSRTDLCTVTMGASKTVTASFKSTGGIQDKGWLAFPLEQKDRNTAGAYGVHISTIVDHVFKSEFELNPKPWDRFTSTLTTGFNSFLGDPEIKYNPSLDNPYSETKVGTCILHGVLKKCSPDGTRRTSARSTYLGWRAPDSDDPAHQWYWYDNHDGTDFVPGNSATANIVSAAAGTVVATDFGCSNTENCWTQPRTQCSKEINIDYPIYENECNNSDPLGCRCIDAKDGDKKIQYYLVRNIGNYIIVRHDNNYSTIYQHLDPSSKPPEVGSHVDQGVKIGIMGSSGGVTGVHLHFEIRNQNDRIVDPYFGLEFCDENNNSNCKDGLKSESLKNDMWDDTLNVYQKLPTTKSQTVLASRIASGNSAKPVGQNLARLSVSASGGGRIAGTMADISCGSGDTKCSGDFGLGAGVGLVALPDNDHEFASWGGDCAGATGSICSISMDAARSVSASFRFRSNPIPAPIQVRPVAGVIDAKSDAFFQWQPVSRAERYWLVVADSPNKLPDHPNDSSCPSCVISAVLDRNAHTAGKSSELLLGRTEPLTPGKTYYWRTQGYQRLAGGGTDDGDWSPILSFRVRNPGQLYAVSVSRSGADGGGFVISEPSGISCGDTCSAPFAEGQAITLTAIADEGLYFDGWDGDCTGQSSTTCLLGSITGPRSATARFKTGELAINGSITTIIAPGGAIAAGAKWRIVGTTNWLDSGATASGLSSAIYDVKFSTIDGWATPNNARVPVNAETPNRNAIGNYVPIKAPGALVNVVFDGDGWGEVRFTDQADRKGVQFCTSDCSVRILSVTTRVLADVGDGSVFGGWTGPCTATGGTDPNLFCDLDMTGGAQTIHARFDKDANATQRTFILDVRSYDQLGTGQVTIIPGGTVCRTGSRCSLSFSDQTRVEMTFAPDAGSSFLAQYREGTSFVVRQRQGSIGTNFRISEDTTWIAEFVDENSRQVNLVQTYAHGRVVSNQLFRDCKPEDQVCKDWFAAGTQFRLVAEPDTGWAFRAWGEDGGLCGTSSSVCAFTVVPARQVYSAEAKFWQPPQTLTLTVEGPGKVTWRDDLFVDHECRDNCDITLAQGTRLTLSDKPDVNGKFVGWGGICAGRYSCNKVIFTDGDRITARFADAPGDQITVTVIPSGEKTGVMAMNNPIRDAILCGDTCSTQISKGTVMILAARSNPAGYRLGRYFLEGTDLSNPLTGDPFGFSPIDRDLTFRTVWYKDEPKTVNVLFAGNGSGSVTSNGQTCTTNCSLSFQVPFLTNLDATASAAEGSIFTGWTLSKNFDYTNECKADSHCTVRALPDNIDLVAHFSRTAPVRLDVAISDSGNSKVTSNPAGIDCEAICSADIAPGTVITLTASPDAGYRFTEWSGDCAGSANTCALVMDDAKSVFANFSSTSNFSLSVVVSGDGAGIISSTPIGIDCGIDCTEGYDSGTSVTLSYTAAARSKFISWNGDCNGSGTCVVLMDKVRSVTAQFDRVVQNDIEYVGAPQVNLISSGDSGLSQPDVTAMVDGGFAVGFVNWVVGTQDPDIKARFFTNTGQAQSSTFSVNTKLNGQQTEPFMLGHSGGVSTFWTHNRQVDGAGWKASIAGRTFDNSAAATSEEYIATPGFSPLVNPAAVQISGGDIILAESDNAQIYLQRLGFDGQRIGAAIPVSNRTGAWQFHPNIAMLADGGFVVVWRDDKYLNADTYGIAIWARIYRADGTSRSEAILVKQNEFGDDKFSNAAGIRPAVSGTPDGGYVIAWRDDSGLGKDQDGSSIQALLFDSTGARAGNIIDVNTTSASDQHSPDIAVLQDGSFVIVWNDESREAPGFTFSDVRAQIFRPDGTKTASEILVNQDTYTNQFEPSIAALTNGAFVIVWTNSNQTNRRNIAGRVFSTTSNGQPSRKLITTIEGQGNGKIRIFPGIRSCKSNCTYDIRDGSRISLVAYPDTPSDIVTWSGDCAGSAKTCTFLMDAEKSVSASFAPGENTLNVSFSGDCTGDGVCVVTMDKAHSVSARFVLIAPDPTTLFSSILPSARSGSMGGAPDAPGRSSPQALGDPVTVFASVINAGASAAQSCRITIPANSPVSLSYQEADATNVPIGIADTLFDVAPAQTRSFVLTLTPTALSTGENVFPDFSCDNANVDAIPGVNTVFLSIADKEVPDILSIGATPSNNGILTVPSGSLGFMTASAINIGVGDAAGSADAAVTVSVDTGAAALSVEPQLCETDASSACITPLGTAPVDTVIGASPSFFAIFVSDQSGGRGVPLDPANARVFLRFTDAAGTVRSVTSAAVTVPTAAADAPATASALPVGRWAVMIRKTTGIRHAQVPGTLYVWPNGYARLESANDNIELQLRSNTDLKTPGAFSGLEENGVLSGQFTVDHSLFMVDQRHNTRLNIWGVHDTRGLDGTTTKAAAQ